MAENTYLLNNKTPVDLLFGHCEDLISRKPRDAKQISKLFGQIADDQIIIDQYNTLQQQSVLLLDDDLNTMIDIGSACAIQKSLKRVRRNCLTLEYENVDALLHGLHNNPSILASLVNIAGFSLLDLADPNKKIKSSDFLQTRALLLRIRRDEIEDSTFRDIDSKNSILNEDSEIVSQSVNRAFKYFSFLFNSPSHKEYNELLKDSPEPNRDLLYQAHLSNEQVYKRLNQLKTQVHQDIIKAIIDPKTESELFDILNQHIFTSVFGDLLDEFQLTDPLVIREIYRALRIKSQISSPYQALFYEMLSFVETEIDNNPDYNPQSDLDDFFEIQTSADTNIWETLTSSTKKLAQEKGTIQATLILTPEQCQEINHIERIGLASASITLDKNNPHTRFSVTFSFNEPDGEGNTTFTVQIDTKKKKISEWSCIIDPNDPEGTKYWSSLLSLSSSVLKSYIAQLPPQQHIDTKNQPQVAQIKKETRVIVPKETIKTKLKTRPKRQREHPEPKNPIIQKESFQKSINYEIPSDIGKLLYEQTDQETIDFLIRKLQYLSHYPRNPKKMEIADIFTYRAGIYHRIVVRKLEHADFPYKVIAIVHRKNLKTFLKQLH